MKDRIREKIIQISNKEITTTILLILELIMIILCLIIMILIYFNDFSSVPAFIAIFFMLFIIEVLLFCESIENTSEKIVKKINLLIFC